MEREGRKSCVIEGPIVDPGAENGNYSIESYCGLFMDRFVATIEKSKVEGIGLERFKKNFFVLNVRQASVRFARELSAQQCVAVYNRMCAAYRIDLQEKIRFLMIVAIIKLFGYERIRRIKRVIAIIARRGRVAKEIS
jgi:hypothetical protein